jgi:soluble lytic murein transglycosylase-like protein
VEELVESLPSPVPEIDAVSSCGLNLLREAGKHGEHVTGLPELYSRASVDKSEEFMQYLLSIIYVESKFNKLAISPALAYGLMQMTEIAVREAAGNCPSLRMLGDMSKLHDSYTNVKYGSCFLKKLLTDMDGDWTRTLIAYNGGYAQLIKYDRGDTITHETSNYVLKVNRALNKICRQK